MSSTYWRWEKRLSPTSNLYPTNLPESVAFLIITLKPYATIKNKKGERESPCLKPRPIENSLVGLPFTNTETNADLRHSKIHLHQFL